jgi:hypothetical protein
LAGQAPPGASQKKKEGKKKTVSLFVAVSLAELLQPPAVYLPVSE